MSLNKLEFEMAIPDVTWEYTPGFCHNSRKPRILPSRRKMRPNCPALGAQQYRVPNQTCKNPQFA